MSEQFVLKVDVLEAGKTSKCEDLSKFLQKSAMARRLQLLCSVPGLH